MKKLKHLMAIATAVLALSLGGKALAQPQGGFGGGAGGPGGGIDFQNMDPQQMMNMIQQRINDSFREQMGVTNDADWALIEEKISAVTKARLATVADAMMGMGGMRGGGGFGGGRPGVGAGAGGGLQNLFGQPSPEAQALQQAVESDAPGAQIHALLVKFQAVRKEKQAALEKAQDDLRSVLTTKQEGIAVLGGLLD
jgi:hypothetical protein